MNKVALDIVEEFLELGREVLWPIQCQLKKNISIAIAVLLGRWGSKVSVTKLMAMFAIIKRRFPARLLPTLVCMVLALRGCERCVAGCACV